ncbi:MAG: hypothetical protein OD811_03275 [Alphaproteobacteria bacterium]
MSPASVFVEVQSAEDVARAICDVLRAGREDTLGAGCKNTEREDTREETDSSESPSLNLINLISAPSAGLHLGAFAFAAMITDQIVALMAVQKNKEGGVRILAVLDCGSSAARAAEAMDVFGDAFGDVFANVSVISVEWGVVCASGDSPAKETSGERGREREALHLELGNHAHARNCALYRTRPDSIRPNP